MFCLWKNGSLTNALPGLRAGVVNDVLRPYGAYGVAVSSSENIRNFKESSSTMWNFSRKVHELSLQCSGVNSKWYNDNISSYYIVLCGFAIFCWLFYCLPEPSVLSRASFLNNVLKARIGALKYYFITNFLRDQYLNTWSHSSSPVAEKRLRTLHVFLRKLTIHQLK